MMPEAERKYVRIGSRMHAVDSATERFIAQIGSRLYAVEAETASHAIIEALAGIGDPDTWPGECIVWNDRYYHERYGEPAGVIQL